MIIVIALDRVRKTFLSFDMMSSEKITTPFYQFERIVADILVFVL